MDSAEIAERIKNPTPEPIPVLPAREFFPLVLNENGLLGEGAEIGVQRGEFSEVLLTHWKGAKLYSIDPWREFSGESYIDRANVEQERQDENHRITCERLAPFGARSVVVRKTSDEAVLDFAAGQLDFAYVDAQHHYEAVARDIRQWWRVVRPGGILAGHDYVPDGMYAFGLFEVKKAVDEFARARNLQVLISEEVSPPGYAAFRSWFLIKPEV